MQAAPITASIGNGVPLTRHSGPAHPGRMSTRTPCTWLHLHRSAGTSRCPCTCAREAAHKGAMQGSGSSRQDSAVLKQQCYACTRRSCVQSPHPQLTACTALPQGPSPGHSGCTPPAARRHSACTFPRGCRDWMCRATGWVIQQKVCPCGCLGSRADVQLIPAGSGRCVLYPGAHHLTHTPSASG